MQMTKFPFPMIKITNSFHSIYVSWSMLFIGIVWFGYFGVYNPPGHVTQCTFRLICIVCTFVRTLDTCVCIPVYCRSSFMRHKSHVSMYSPACSDQTCSIPFRTLQSFCLRITIKSSALQNEMK